MRQPFVEKPTFVGHTGIELMDASSERVTGRLEIQDIHHQPYGVVHGGVYTTFVETLASAGAAMWAIEQGMAGAVGVSNQTDFVKATAEGVLLGEATPVHRGRRQQLWRVVVSREGDGAMAAQGQVRLHNITDMEAF